MDFKSLINKLDSMEAPVATPKAPELPKAVQLDEDHALKVLAGTKTLNEAVNLMEKKATEDKKAKEEKVKENAFTDKPKSDMKVGDKKTSSTGGTIEKTKTGVKHTAGKNYGGDVEDKKKSKKDESVDVEAFKSKFAQMVAEAKKKKPDADNDGVPDWADEKPGEDDNADKKKKKAGAKKGAPAAKKGMSAKQAKYFGKKKAVKESVFESEEEGVEDLLAAVEEEINEPGRHTDNLRDVMNATFEADDSPEYEKARAVIEKYLDLVDNASAGSEEDGIKPMRGNDVAHHIDMYDLTDRLQHAAAMLDKVVGMGEGLGRELGDTPRDNLIKRLSPTIMDEKTLMKSVAKVINSPEFTSDTVLKIVDAGSSITHPVGKFIQKEFDELQYDLGRKYEDMPEEVAEQLIVQLKRRTKEYVGESAEKRAPAKKAERQVELPSGAKVKATKVQGWQSQKADKEAKKDEGKKMSGKKMVKESYEPKLTFRDMIKLVQESGGQQAIDPLDKELFAWASRVAKQKLGEGMKAEVYAGMVYERMGGVFNMYDVLSEDKK
jgi:hypothetical protein